jgi:hypothetical protein
MGVLSALDVARRRRSAMKEDNLRAIEKIATAASLPAYASRL